MGDTEEIAMVDLDLLRLFLVIKDFVERLHFICLST